MRIWSLHPCYLDSKGLVALWRETLLAKKVLENKTNGYKNHPQLNRFKKCKQPLMAINSYLSEVFYEAGKRGYNFNKNKIDWNFEEPIKIPVSTGQLEYETSHLKSKLKIRDSKKFNELTSMDLLRAHPLFFSVDGAVEDWEIVKK